MNVKKHFQKAVNLEDNQGELIGRDLVDRVSFEIARLHELKSLITSQKKQVPSSELLKEIGCELIRLKELNIPLQVQHITNPMTDNKPREYETNFKKLINAHDAVTETLWFLEEQCERFEINMVSDEVSNLEKLVLVKNFVDTNELHSHAMFTLGLATGLHNQEMYASHFTRSGINKVQSEQLKALNWFDRRYGLAMRFMRDVLVDFYADKAHHSFKPALVIEQMDNLCALHGVAFPKDRNGKNYKSIYKTIMSFIPSNPNWKKKTKENYAQIDNKFFKNKYEKDLLKLIVNSNTVAR
jgi:hypothetical protein